MEPVRPEGLPGEDGHEPRESPRREGPGPRRMDRPDEDLGGGPRAAPGPGPRDLRRRGLPQDAHGRPPEPARGAGHEGRGRLRPRTLARRRRPARRRGRLEFRGRGGMTKAIIIAAGMGRRLLPLTKDRPKCALRIDGQSLLDRELSIFRSLGITDITLVTGYRGDA